jgi:hypothetical protein
MRPIVGDDEILSDILKVRVAVRKIGKEFCSHFTEEGAYDHVQFFQAGAFLPHCQQTVYDQGNEEDLNGDKGDILEKIEKGIPGGMKDLNFYKIEKRG